MAHPLPAGNDLRLARQQADGQDQRHSHRILQAWAQLSKALTVSLVGQSAWDAHVLVRQQTQVRHRAVRIEAHAGRAVDVERMLTL